MLNLARTRRAIAVVDDRDARRAARALGVSAVSTLGGVLAAQRDGRIVSAAQIFLDRGAPVSGSSIRQMRP